MGGIIMNTKKMSMYYIERFDCTLIIVDELLYRLTEYLDNGHELTFSDIKKTDTIKGNKAFLTKTSTEKNYRLNIRDENGKNHRAFSSYETLRKCTPGWECFNCQYPDCIYSGLETPEEKEIYKMGNHRKEGVPYVI